MVTEIAKLKENKRDYDDRISRHYNVEIDRMAEISSLRGQLSAAQEKIDELMEQSQTSGSRAAQDFHRRLMEMDKKHLREKEALYDHANITLNLSANSDRNKSNTSSLLSGDIVIHEDGGEAVVSEDESEVSKISDAEESEEELDIENFALRKSIASNRYATFGG